MENDVSKKVNNNIRQIIETVVVTFILGQGIHYFSQFFRSKYFAWLKTLTVDEGMNHILMYAGHIIFLVVMLWYAWCVKNDRKYILSFAKGKLSRNFKCALLGAITGFAMMAMCVFAASLNGNLEIHPAAYVNVSLFLLAFLAVWLQSSTEEIESRGFVFGRMYGEGVPVITAAAVSGFFFSFLHVSSPGYGLIPFTTILLIGILFALSVYYFGSIWFACMLHTMWNFSQDFIFGLPDSGLPSSVSIFNTTVKGSGFFYDATFGIEGSLMAILVTIIVTIIVVIVGKRVRKLRDIEENNG